MVLKAYKFRIYPDNEQAYFINNCINSCRYVFNWALEQEKNEYETNKKMIGKYGLNKKLTELKQDKIWLYETPNQSLQYSIENLDNAYKHFFRRCKKGETPGYPKFKSRFNPVQSFRFINSYHIFWDRNTIKIPKLKSEINAIFDRKVEGKLRTATISRTNTNKYFISILIDDGLEPTKQIEYDETNTIGIDLGIKDFATLSNGEKIDNPHILKNLEIKLAKEQRKLSRKKKGSSNYNKQKIKVARVHEKIANQRSDFQHKLSRKLVNENAAIALEDLKIKNMVKNRHLSKCISDASWGEFKTQLVYKAEWAGKTILKINTFAPSSKTCSICGYKYVDLSLSERNWICPECNTNHDRDINAAINIKNFALKENI